MDTELAPFFIFIFSEPWASPFPYLSIDHSCELELNYHQSDFFKDLVDVAPCSPFVLWTTLSPPFKSDSESKAPGSAILRCLVSVSAKSGVFFPSAFRSESGFGEAWVTERFWLAVGSGVWLAGCAPSPGWECWVRTASKCCRQPWTVSVLNFPAD